MNKSIRYSVGTGLAIVGIALIVGAFFLIFKDDKVDGAIVAGAIAIMLIGCAMLSLGAVILLGGNIKKLAFGKYFSSEIHTGIEVERRELDEDEIKERVHYAEERALPGRDAPDYSATANPALNALLVRPSAYPTTPMYMLDNHFRIVDWNSAFSLAFDRTMEGRHGLSILEWTYFLENFQEVLDHGEEVFGGGGDLPDIDVEDIRYNSLRYGGIDATKRAYRIPDDEGECLAWLVTLELRFDNPAQRGQYQEDLLAIISQNYMWSEYALVYDKVLRRSSLYQELLSTMVGDNGEAAPIPCNARILDLGAGTGNLSLKLIEDEPERRIVAIENNRVMLELLTTKCHEHLTELEDSPGILVVKQDITSLHGLRSDYFDYVLSNNVFYALGDVDSCLKEVHRVLKPGGELRMTGPRDDSRIKILFNALRADLEKQGSFRELEPAFERVKQINEWRLKPMLHRWSTDQFKQLLVKEHGFAGISAESNELYAGQSMFLCATKPGVPSSGDETGMMKAPEPAMAG